MLNDDEITTPDSPSAFFKILTGQQRIEGLVLHLTDETVAMRSEVSGLVSRVSTLERQFSAMKLMTSHFPFLFSVLSLCVSVGAIIVAMRLR